MDKTQYFQNMIKNSYEKLLKREPDKPGFDNYLHLLQNHEINEFQLSELIKSSPEFLASHPEIIPNVIFPEKLENIPEPKIVATFRIKNEERWITNTLESVFAQNFKDFEVIIGDNESIDKTVNKAKKYPIKEVIKITEYLPGKALNQCINNANGEYLVFLSAHCIPANSKWLENLVNALEENENYAGVYGRQEPMSFSSISDKRDMHIIFGLDRKIQKKDSFFHNANSIIRKNLWKQIQFDEKTTNIEDRIKALDAIRRKFYLLADITLKNHLTLNDTFAEFKTKYLEFYENYN